MARAARPVWLLDIDGVVNALAPGPLPRAWPEDEWVQRVVHANVPGRGPMVLPILAARPVLTFVGDVVRSGSADVVWHSTWRASAVTDLAPMLGLPPIPISVAPEWMPEWTPKWTQRADGVWWKLPAAQRVVAAGRPLVWTDDDLGVLADQVAALAEHPDTLLIGPDPQTGITADQLETIAAFLSRC
jgi:hypothetical protein